MVNDYMKLLIASDAHIFKTSDGKYWSKYIYDYQFWTRYLNIFNSVRIVARVKPIDELKSDLKQVDGYGVEVYEIPFYQGPKQLLFKYFSIHNALRGVHIGCDAALLRMPSQIAQMTLSHIKNKLPIAGEIVYDPSDDLRRNDINFFQRILYEIIHTNLKMFCASVNGVSYVTKNSIQKNYPSHASLFGESDKYFETFYSTITLEKSAFTSPRDYSTITSLCAVLSDVAMNGERKGEKTLIEAIKKGRDKGYDLRAIIVGDGHKRIEFEKYAQKLEVLKYINFTGLLPSSHEVREVMLKADIFVFPTRAEGLPRGILEAMAIGMPVLSTPVGGIPEVLDEDCMFDPMDSSSFCNAMCDMLENPSKLTELSKKNYLIAKQFENSILQKRRDEFYAKIIALCKKSEV